MPTWNPNPLKVHATEPKLIVRLPTNHYKTSVFNFFVYTLPTVCLSSEVCCEASFSASMVVRSWIFLHILGIVFVTQMSRWEIKRVWYWSLWYIYFVQIVRGIWDQRRLWRQAWLKHDVINGVPTESHMSHLSIIYLSYMNHVGCIRPCHRASLPYMRNTRSSCIPTMLGRRHNDTVKVYDAEKEGGGRSGPLSQRWHQRIHIHTQGIPSHPDHTAADTRPSVSPPTSSLPFKLFDTHTGQP